MKYTFFVAAFILMSLTNLKSQTSFSCTSRQYCYWVESTNKYGNCKEFEENSLFVINKDETSISHTVENMKSKFTVTEKQYDKELDVWTFQVLAKDNKKFTYIFDPRNKEVRCSPVKAEKTSMMVFSVKSIY